MAYLESLPCDETVLDEGFIGWKHFTKGCADSTKAQNIGQHYVPWNRLIMDATIHHLILISYYSTEYKKRPRKYMKKQEQWCAIYFEQLTQLNLKFYLYVHSMPCHMISPHEFGCPHNASLAFHVDKSVAISKQQIGAGKGKKLFPPGNDDVQP